MIIDYSKNFIKQLSKSDQAIQVAFKERLQLFIEDKFDLQ